MRAIRLAHVSSDCRCGLVVSSLHKQRYNTFSDQQGIGRLTAVALDGIDTLMSLTLPTRSKGGEGTQRHPIQRYRDQALVHSAWSQEHWRVGSMELVGRSWGSDDTWVAFTDSIPDVYVVLVGIRMNAAAIELDKLTDATRYGFELSAPITMRHLSRRPCGIELPRADEESIRISDST
jgi:hypothetical protein